MIAWPGLAIAVAMTACASSGGETILDVDDPTGDVRLTLAPGAVTAAAFDLEHVSLVRTAQGLELTATFAEPIATLGDVRAARDRVVSVIPQTIDVYVDTTADGRGHSKALPGRDFRVPASQGWERVLVVSSLDDLSDDDVVHPLRLTVRGRRLTALFPKDALPGPVKGALVVVLATSTASEGRVRAIARGTGDCQVWDDARCTLSGDGPPILDAAGSAKIAPGVPLELTYSPGMKPEPEGVKIVFARGPLVGVAPVTADVAKGRLATLVDGGGAPLGTAVVLSVVGDTATLEVIGGASGEGAASVVFAAGGDR